MQSNAVCTCSACSAVGWRGLGAQPQFRGVVVWFKFWKFRCFPCAAFHLQKSLSIQNDDFRLGWSRELATWQHTAVGETQDKLTLITRMVPGNLHLSFLKSSERSQCEYQANPRKQTKVRFMFRLGAAKSATRLFYVVLSPVLVAAPVIRAMDILLSLVAGSCKNNSTVSDSCVVVSV